MRATARLSCTTSLAAGPMRSSSCTVPQSQAYCRLSFGRRALMRCCSPAAKPTRAESTGCGILPGGPDLLRSSCCVTAPARAQVRARHCTRVLPCAGAESHDEIRSRKLIRAVGAAAEKSGHGARRLAHGCRRARSIRRFSVAFVRGYRRIRQLAGGRISDLYLAESEQAGAPGCAQSARVTRSRKTISTSPFGASCRNTRSCGA